MAQIGAAAVCGIVAVTVCLGFLKGLPVLELFIDGAKEGARSAVKLLPVLVGMITAISMLRASGILNAAAECLQPVLSRAGVHPDLVPLILLRPFSGSGSVSYVAELLERYGADAAVSRIAVILSSSTETTFYAAAVYFGGRGFQKTKYAIPAALCGDAAAVVFSIIAVRIFG